MLTFKARRKSTRMASLFSCKKDKISIILREVGALSVLKVFVERYTAWLFLIYKFFTSKCSFSIYISSYCSENEYVSTGVKHVMAKTYELDSTIMAKRCDHNGVSN